MDKKAIELAKYRLERAKELIKLVEEKINEYLRN